MADIGANILKRRKELGMTQDELAALTGYKSKSSINKIEMGSRELPQSKIIVFAEALHTTPSVLMGWVDAETEKKNDDLIKAIVQMRKNPALIKIVLSLSEMPAEDLASVERIVSAISMNK